MKAKLEQGAAKDVSGRESDNATAFKVEVLLDLLATARADARKAENLYEKERVKGDLWRVEVSRLYKVCEEKGVDAGEPGGEQT